MTDQQWDAVVAVMGQGWLQALVVAGLYVAGAIVVRWILIAEPYRNYIRARRTALATQLRGLQATDEERNDLELLLDDVDRQLAHREILVWGRGRERAAGWQLMTAERLAARLLPDEDAVAHALTVLDGLQKLPASRRPEALTGALAARLLAVDDPSTWSALDQPQLRALSDQGLALLQAESNGRAADHLAFHRKTFWSMVTAFLITVSVAAAFGQTQLLLGGAMGAAVSRLLLLIRSRDVPRDFATLWTTLLLSPFVGALAAYGGVLLIATLRELDLLGDAASSFAWPQPGAGPTAAVLGLAFLFGFSERLLDRVARRAEGGLAPADPPEKATAPPTPVPTPDAGSSPSGSAAPSQSGSQPAPSAPTTQEGQ